MITATILGPGRARIVLGGTKGSQVSLTTVRSGRVETGSGNDVITGWTETTGRMEILAGGGNDTITGSGAGNDRLTGGNGPDIFRFIRGEGGYDMVMDLRTDDRIQLQGYTRAEVTKLDTGTWIELHLPGGQTIQVVNCRIDTFSEWQLLFS